MTRCAAHSFSRMIMREKLRRRTEFAKDFKNKANYQETETLFCNILAILCAYASLTEVLHFTFPPEYDFTARTLCIPIVPFLFSPYFGKMLCKTVLCAVFCLIAPINRDFGVEYDPNSKFIKAFW